MFNKGDADLRILRTLEVLYGDKVPEDVPELVMRIAQVIEDPRLLPSHVEYITQHEGIKDLRFHLVRMQLESELRVREDVDRHSSRLWVSQTLERIAFGELLVEGIKREEEEEE